MRANRAALGAAVALLIVALAGATGTSHAAGRTLRVGGYSFFAYLSPTDCSQDNPLGVGTFAGFRADQCAYVRFVVDGGGTTINGGAPGLNPAPGFTVTFTDQSGTQVGTTTPAHEDGDTWRFDINPGAWTDLEPGTITFALTSTSGDTLAGQPRFQFTVNALGTRTLLDQPVYATAPGGLPASDLLVHGVTWERYTKAAFVASDPTDGAPNPDLKPAAVTVTLTPMSGPPVVKTTTADTFGVFEVNYSAAEIGSVAATAATGWETSIPITTTAVYDDAVNGTWKTASVDTESTAYAVFRTAPSGPEMRTSFVSERGWVAPGETYVHAIQYRNFSAVPATGTIITDVLPPGAVFVSATPAPGNVSGNTLSWNVGTLAPQTPPDNLATLHRTWPSKILVTARAQTTSQNPRILFRDLSDTASMSWSAGTAPDSRAHGPQVRTQETARLGDRPFPVVLVDYSDFKHSTAANAWSFHERINGADNPASLYRHYQNMSYGQLFPRGEVASFGAPGAATFAAGGPFKWSNPYLKGDTCTGTTLVPPDPTGAASVTFAPPGPRVTDGWYQLPGQRNYYGQDGRGSAIAPVGSLDGGCGPTGKAAHDAASAADPDVDYNEFDSDRNCLVDFFEVAFQGRGGNGDSQAHGYDNIWPHSGNLQDTYIDANGQLGYVSNDQCRDRLERPLWWTEASRATLTTANSGDALKAFSRIGPYNVNPENGTASVFAHEYGHSLGLPDLYSTGGRSTIDFWDLMSQDGFQYMGVFSRQDLGWIVPKRVPTATTTTLKDSKIDTHKIHAVGADGVPYVLSGPGVHNGDAWYVELPHRTLFERVPSGKYAQWSTAGNGFGCPGKYVDLRLNTTLQAPEGSALSLTMKSWYEIEWDFDYGFVLLSTDGGKTFAALESANGTTTPQTYNPNGNVCQQQYGNGITGTSTALDFPQNLTTRQNGDYPAPAFIDDEFDVSACAGKACVIRFAYSTDTGLAKRGWVIDDLRIAGADKTYFADDFERERLGTYQNSRWLRFRAGPSPFDHGYFLELRDRTSNDFDSAGQGERHPIDFIPGVSIWYTDEAHGYGNTGTDDPPAQTVVDPRMQPGESMPRLSDASFYPMTGLNTFSDRAWTDNYVDADGQNFGFRFGCFTMNVNSLSGLGTGAAAASLHMTTSPTKCVRVLGIAQGRPKPPVLPATGLGDDAWITLGLSLCALALALRRPLVVGAVRYWRV
ncbi:MAG: immune inhibitor A domain-containing protein [Actinomycetota bacterium]